MNELYPIFLKTNQLNLLIIGGGNVALEKLTFLHKSSPNSKITLVADTILPQVHELLNTFNNPIVFIRAFSVEDLANKHLVIAATNNPALNSYLRFLADKYSFLLNVADTPELCDFYLGGIVTKGDLKIAISTNGKSPVMAKRIRQWFESILPDSLDKTLALTSVFRNKQKGKFEDKLKKLNALTEDLIS